MIELKNITFEQYANLLDKSEYDWAMQFVFIFKKPVDHCNIGEFESKEFGLIKDLQQDISQGVKWDKMLEYISTLTNQQIDVLVKEKLLTICQIKNFIVSEIERLSFYESEKLGHTPTDEEIRAGIDNFNVFGVYSQLLQLAKGDPLKIPEVRKMTWQDAFVYLVHQKTESDYQIRLMEIRAEKNK